MGDIIVGLIVGFVGGFAGGMLGVGGGAIYIPAMVLFLDKPQHLAQGASLAAMIATAIVGGVTHLRQRNVRLATVADVAPPAVVAGFGGALLADTLDAEVLRRIFAVVILYFALTMIIGAVRMGRVAVQEGENQEHG